MRQLVLTTLPILFAILIACSDSNDGGSTGPSPTTTTTVPEPVVREFTLRARDCFFSWSRPLVTLSANDEFTVRFKPLSIPEERGDEWANVVSFWLDGDEELGPNSLALVLVWQPDSQWFIDFYQDEFLTTGETELISLGGRFREVTILRRNGVSEWLLDGVSVLQFPDTKPQRIVHTRVVGSEALFQYEERSTSALREHPSPTTNVSCMLGVGITCPRI